MSKRVPFSIRGYRAWGENFALNQAPKEHAPPTAEELRRRRNKVCIELLEEERLLKEQLAEW